MSFTKEFGIHFSLSELQFSLAFLEEWAARMWEGGLREGKDIGLINGSNRYE